MEVCITCHSCWRREKADYVAETYSRDLPTAAASHFLLHSHSLASSYELPSTYKPYYQLTTHQDQRPLHGSCNASNMPIYPHLSYTGAARYYWMRLGCAGSFKSCWCRWHCSIAKFHFEPSVRYTPSLVSCQQTEVLILFLYIRGGGAPFSSCTGIDLLMNLLRHNLVLEATK